MWWLPDCYKKLCTLTLILIRVFKSRPVGSAVQESVTREIGFVLKQ